ncbi:hypothetical protein ACFY7Z_10285 [Streptomyces sp. NPDC012623]|uniref:hypothetical protein n=1 Tax=unclassified Streptomyces TaxID=2593676 RepID=UPI00367488A1
MTAPAGPPARPECRVEEHELCDGDEGIRVDGRVALRLCCGCTCHSGDSRALTADRARDRSTGRGFPTDQEQQ